jgi:hypothetical protein
LANYNYTVPFNKIDKEARNIVSAKTANRKKRRR